MKTTMILAELGWLGLMGLLELFFSQWERGAHPGRRQARNLLLAFVNHVLTPPVALTAMLMLGPQIGSRAAAGLLWPIAFGITVLALDFVGYRLHLMHHKIEFLWRFHQVHHMDEELDFTTGTRVHTVEVAVYQVVMTATVLVLGVPASCFVAFATVNFFMAVFHHANLALPRRVELVLRHLTFTPATHGAHHHELIEDNQTNYGFIFPWWDQIFGTYNTLARQPEWRMGVAYARDLPLFALLAAPAHITRVGPSPQSAKAS